MKLDVKIDTYRFYRMLEQLKAELPGVAFRDIIDYEVGRVLVAASNRTRSATRRSIRKTFSEGEMQDHATPTKPNDWYYAGGKYRVRKWRLPDDEWRAYKAARKARMDEKIKRAGLARQGWSHIADALNLQVSAPSINRARLARVNGKKLNHPSTGRRMETGLDNYSIMITYGTLAGRGAGARAALQRAVNGRVNYFNRNLRLGVFRKTENIAKRYPGILVH